MLRGKNNADARGAPVRINPAVVCELASTHKALRPSARPIVRAWSWSLLVPMMAITAGLTILLRWTEQVTGFPPRWVAIFAGVTVGTVVHQAMFQRRGRRRWADFANHAVRLGLCPACGYEIGGTPVQADGCRVCPECAHAWRSPEVPGNPEPPERA